MDINKNEPYQMDLFDLDDKEYQPIPWQSNPFSISTLYLCPKCKEWVGVYTDEAGWQRQKDQCPNGHKIRWDTIGNL